MHLTKRKKRWFMRWGLVFIILFSLSGLSLFFVVRSLSPIVNYYKPAIAVNLSQMLDAHVDIGLLKTNWYGINPVIEFHDVVIEHNNSPIQFKTLLVGLNLIKTLSKKKLVPNLVVIDALDLKISGQQNQSILSLFETLDIDNQVFSWDALKDFLVNQEALIITNTTLHYWVENEERLTLSGIKLSLEREDNDYMFDLQMKDQFSHAPNLEAYGNLSLEQNGLNGKIFLGTHNLSGPLLSELPIKDMKITKGSGDAKTWLSFKDSQIIAVYSQVNLKNINITHPVFLKPWHIDALQGHIQIDRQAHGFALDADHINLNQNNKKLAPLFINWSYDALNETHELNISSLTFSFIKSLPWANQTLVNFLNQRIKSATLAPIKLHLSQEKLSNLHIRASNVNLKSIGYLPALSGLKGDLELNKEKGSLNLNGFNYQINSPYIQPFMGTKLSLNATWRKSKNAITGEINKIYLNIPHGVIKGKGRFTSLDNIELNLAAAFKQEMMTLKNLPLLKNNKYVLMLKDFEGARAQFNIKGNIEKFSTDLTFEIMKLTLVSFIKLNLSQVKGSIHLNEQYQWKGVVQGIRGGSPFKIELDSARPATPLVHGF